jgi:hypothetical protein
MALGELLIIKNSYNNIPFVRELNVTLQTRAFGSFEPFRNIDPADDQMFWQFDTSSVWAKKNLGNTPYISNSLEPAFDLKSMTFYTSADYYNATVDEYTLLTTTITAAYTSADPFFDQTVALLHLDFNVTKTFLGVLVNSQAFTGLLTPDPDIPNTFIKDVNQNTRIYLAYNDVLSGWEIGNEISEEIFYINETPVYDNNQWAPASPTYLDQPILTKSFNITTSAPNPIPDSSKFSLGYTLAANNIQITSGDGGPPTPSFDFEDGRAFGRFRQTVNNEPADSLIEIRPNNLAAAQNFDFDSDDNFTIELWVRFAGWSGGDKILLVTKNPDTKNLTNSPGWCLYYDVDALSLIWGYCTENHVIANLRDLRGQGNSGLLVGTWYHVAVARHNGTLRLYLDGEQKGTNSNNTKSYVNNKPFALNDSSKYVGLGRGPSANGRRGRIPTGDGKTRRSNQFYGGIDEVRITKGVARYTGTTFPLQNRNYPDSAPTSFTSKTITLSYDTYPFIPNWPVVKVNFETTENFSYFYRPLGANFTFNITLPTDETFLNSQAKVKNLTNQQTTNYSNLNNITIPSRSTPTVFEINVQTQTNTPQPSIAEWYTSHVVSNSISANFVKYPGNASNFIAYPSRFFDSTGQQQLLTPSNASTLSPGVCFFGEGHTEIINLSAPFSNEIQLYIWSVGNVDFEVTPPTESIATVSIPTQVGSYPTIPISLLLTTQNILSDGPIYFYNDTTGAKTFYPFYYSTYDLDSQQETPQNTRLRQSIQVVSYDSVLSAYSTNLSGTIFLPVDGSYQSFFGRLAGNLYGRKINSLDPCYDKYDIIWRWSSLIDGPVTWDDVAVTGLSGKKWQREGFFFGNPSEITSPTFCIGSNLTWVLSTPKWSTGTVIDSVEGNVDITDFSFPLQYFTDGSTPYTVSIYENTPVLLFGEQIITCTISAEPFDWAQKTTALRGITNASVLSRGDIQLYIPSRYVLSGEEVLFRNISQGLNNVSSVYIDFDNTSNVLLTGEDITKSVYTSYNTLGPKTVTVTTNYTTNSAIVDTFTDFLNVVPFFDTVNPDNYITTRSIFKLPWSNVPFIAPNEWVVEDNINSVIKKFYENLNYLIKRSNSYYETPLGFYGWLGTVPIEITKKCPFWTWEDLECLAETNTKEITWNDTICSLFSQGIIPSDFSINLPYSEIPNVYIDPPGDPNTILKITFSNAIARDVVRDELTSSFWIYTGERWTLLTPITGITSEFANLTAGGPLSACATWNQHICTQEIQNPNCFGKHQLNWNWKSRKSTSTNKPITWQQTKFEQPFQKKWIYEPYINSDGQIITGTACEEGYWHVDLKKLNEYYDPIINCTSIQKCSYNSIVAYDDNLITALNTELKALTSDYSATFVANRLTLNELYSFQNIKSLAIDTENKVFVLDGSLNRVACYSINLNDDNPFELIISWGGFGTSNSESRFSRPNDIHVDGINNVWVADTGNKCIKQYSNTGTWIMTLKDEDFNITSPTSMCVDSSNNLHVLVKTKIRVYNYTGTYLFEYNLTDITEDEPIRIRSNYNRELIYVVYSNKVLKYFKNGMYAGYVIDRKECANNITDVFQDRYRNVLISAGDKILKFEDPMRVRQFTASLPEEYWSLDSLLIDREEYVQNWVYSRAFQRLWDNIEIVRGLLVYNNEDCKTYRPPVYQKDKIYIGQNEIVTSSVINRLIAYLWTNFSTLVKYFESGCKQLN